jgi:hypothetical protein
MRKFILIYTALVSLLIISCSRSDKYISGKWIDLTYEYSSESIYWPTAEEFKLEKVFEGKTDKGNYYSAYHYSADELQLRKSI